LPVGNAAASEIISWGVDLLFLKYPPLSVAGNLLPEMKVIVRLPPPVAIIRAHMKNVLATPTLW
jgi:hypothetical protein